MQSNLNNSYPLSSPLDDCAVQKLVQKLWKEEMSSIRSSATTFIICPLALTDLPLIYYAPGFKDRHVLQTIFCDQNKVRSIIVDEVVLQQTTCFLELLRFLDVAVCDLRKITFALWKMKSNRQEFFQKVVESIPNVIHFCFYGQLYGNEKELLGLTKLLYLTLNNVHDKVMEVISGIVQLKCLRLVKCGLTEQGLAMIPRLANLEYLQIDNGKMIQSGEKPFDEIARTLTKLQWLKFHIADFSLNNQYFKSLTLFQSLKQLTLLNIRKTHTLIFYVSQHLRQLEKLILSNVNRKPVFEIDEGGVLRLVTNCTNLTFLKLFSYRVILKRDFRKMAGRIDMVLESQRRSVVDGSYCEDICLKISFGEEGVNKLKKGWMF